MKSRSFEDSADRQAGLLSEKRVFLKSGSETRFVRIRARDQILAWIGGFTLVAWTVAATALLAVQYVQGNATREQAAEDRAVYETRITALASERDRRHKEALAAQEQFATLLSQLSTLQDRIFEAELTAAERTDETESLKARLRTAQSALDNTSRQLASLSEGAETGAPSVPNATLTVMTDAISDMATERDALAQKLSDARDRDCGPETDRAPRRRAGRSHFPEA